ncbi:MAG TPA: hypothetical protein VN213_19220 [Solirubrobacteraceae bacterium]|nr:hypothetical protein [Solirubrobacteraceae bacterium]
MSGTSWARIEPHAQTTDIDVGLAAEIADPLWLLARQLQLHEFKGDDAGSPIGIHMQASWSSLTRYRPGPLPADGDGSADAVAYDAGTSPLEALVEAEPPRDADDAHHRWDERARTGRRLERLLGAVHEDAVVAALRARFPFPDRAASDALPLSGDAAAERYAAVLGGRLTDGLAVRLDAAGRGDAAHPDMLAAAGDPAQVASTFAAWVEWSDAVAPLRGTGRSGSPAWDPQRLEYAFAVAAPPFLGSEPGAPDIVLAADEYDGTGVDWYSVDLVPDATLGAPAPDGAAGVLRQRVLPKPVRYSGMPADRFWEMEDAHVNLGAVGSGPTDLARMLAVEYAVVYGPDWFLAPLELPVGCVARIDWIAVRDTFGVVTLVGTPETQGADRAGRQYQPAVRADEVADIPLLVLPPSSARALRSAPLERVDLQRDELANLAWAIQRVTLGAGGRGVARTDTDAKPLPEPEDPQDAELLWRLATSVAPSWLPLAAVRQGADEDGRVALVPAPLVDAADAAPRPIGQLLEELDVIAEEEVTRAGVRVQLLDQLVRWIDGGSVLWRGREKTAGSGEVESRLFFDYTEPV